MDQGGELWNIHDLHGVADDATYVVEPTGSDAASENGKVECPNGTLAAMVRCLLYSAGLAPNMWSAALRHAVYLKNRLWHSAINMTPFQAFTGTIPSLEHLWCFGSLITARKPGKRPAKADKHTPHGILIGCVTTAKHVLYPDSRTKREKTSSHHTIDEGHFSVACRPPGPQVLMDMGYDQPPIAVPGPVPFAPYPASSPRKPVKLSRLPLFIPLPLYEFTHTLAASAARLKAHDGERPDTYSIVFSTDPFGPSFDKEISVSGIHETAGLIVDRSRCQITNIAPSTSAHSIPQ
jgi:hypothetical protein